MAKAFALVMIAVVPVLAKAQGGCVQCWGDFCVSNEYGRTSCRWLCPKEPGVCQCIPAGQNCTSASIQLFNLLAMVVSSTGVASECSPPSRMAPEAPSSATSPPVLIATTGPLKDLASRRPVDNARCRDVPSKSGDGRSMLLCGDVPEEDNAFSFVAAEGLLMQLVEVSPPYAQAVLALRNFSQHGGLEFGLDTRMNVNTNPTREQVIKIVRGETISREEADLFNSGDREAFDVRVLERSAFGALTIELQSMKDRSAKLTLRLKVVGDRNYVLQEWQFN